MSTPAVTPQFDFAALGQRIKAKHPEYADMPDAVVGQKVLAKYPQYADLARPAAPTGVPGAPQPMPSPAAAPSPQSGPIPSPAQTPGQPNMPPPPQPQANPASPAAGMPTGNTAQDLIGGVGQGLLSTVGDVGNLIRKVPGIGPHLIPQQGQDALREISRPKNTAQSVGSIAEQAGELALPTGAVSDVAKLAKLSPRALAIARLVGNSGVMAGMEKLRGGSNAGAAGAAALNVATEGGISTLQKLAPVLLKLGIPMNSKAAKAILEMTSGTEPGKIADSAQQAINGLKNSRDAAIQQVGASGATANIKPAIDLIDQRIIQELNPTGQLAVKGNNTKTLEQLRQLRSSLTAMVDDSGNVIGRVPQHLHPQAAIDLKDSVGKIIKSWGKDITPTADVVRKQVYHALDNSVDSIVPGHAKANDAISALSMGRKAAVGTAKKLDTTSILQSHGVLEALGHTIMGAPAAATARLAASPKTAAFLEALRNGMLAASTGR
jgi:hypothetical protein